MSGQEQLMAAGGGLGAAPTPDAGGWSGMGSLPGYTPPDPGWGPYQGYTPPAAETGDLKSKLAGMAFNQFTKAMGGQQRQQGPMMPPPQHMMGLRIPQGQPMGMPALYQPTPMGRLRG